MLLHRGLVEEEQVRNNDYWIQQTMADSDERDSKPHPFHIDGLLGLDSKSRSQQLTPAGNASKQETSNVDASASSQSTSESSPAVTPVPQIPLPHFVYGVAAVTCGAVVHPSPSLHSAVSLWNNHQPLPTTVAMIASK